MNGSIITKNTKFLIVGLGVISYAPFIRKKNEIR